MTSQPASKNDPALSPPGSHRGRLSVLEWLTVGHVGAFVVATTWAFGGQADWVRAPLAWWGTLGILITAVGIRDLIHRPGRNHAVLWWLLPFLVFNGLVIAGALNPSLREIRVDGELQYIPSASRAGWPSAAVPASALRELWIFDAIWVACYNLALVIRRRRAIRGLLLLVVVNALVLSVFGTVQRLTRATGLYFGAYSTRQNQFFASFVYHNHWGAFILLMMAACLALTWCYARRREARDIFHSPAFGGVVALLIMAATIPLSASRSSTILGIILLGGAFLHWTIRFIRQRRHFHESIAPALLGAGVAGLVGLGGIVYLSRDTIVRRAELTRTQLGEMRANLQSDARVLLYRNTWRMARAKPWFGWGMASYPYVFTLYNTQESVDGFPIYYHDAHSDWLQSLAEHGVVGSALLLLLAVLPLISVSRAEFANPLSTYLLGGCVVVLLYAGVEFPFGNFAVVLTWWLCLFCGLRYALLRDPTPPAPA
ncbi:MAG TPA: O-antigen ligase family protein [Opitutaceae bacterium]|nr:O-antigen ligase family protein [Opitutaceae bacterium]